MASTFLLCARGKTQMIPTANKMSRTGQLVRKSTENCTSRCFKRQRLPTTSSSMSSYGKIASKRENVSRKRTHSFKTIKRSRVRYARMLKESTSWFKAKLNWLTRSMPSLSMNCAHCPWMTLLAIQSFWTSRQPLTSEMCTLQSPTQQTI